MKACKNEDIQIQYDELEKHRVQRKKEGRRVGVEEGRKLCSNENCLILSTKVQIPAIVSFSLFESDQLPKRSSCHTSDHQSIY